jgi:protein-tyrosine phosphatase/arsenate reductase
MFQKLKTFSKEISNDFDQIPHERKLLLTKITAFIQQRKDKNEPIQLIYICTHNSRRSHFGQVAAALAGEFYNIKNLKSYSAGTEATALNINAINALIEIGFDVEKENDSINPIFKVSFSDKSYVECFSKKVTHDVNPSENFAAIMTCSDADQNCPVIVGATLRIGTTYEDPKISDNTPLQKATYLARFRQIATETFYAFSLLK